MPIDTLIDTIKDNKAHSRLLTDYWMEKYKSKFGYKYDFKKVDGVNIAKLRKTFNDDIIKNIMDTLINTTDEFLLKMGVTIGTLKNQANKLAQLSNTQSNKPLTMIQKMEKKYGHQ